MITLEANKFLGALTNLVAFTQVADTLKGGELGEFVNSFQDINVDTGNGKVIRSSDIYDVEDLSATSSLLTSNLPTVAEQYIPVTNYKVIPLTLNEYLMRGAFVKEDQLAYFIAHLMATMETSKTIYMANAIINELESYTPTNSEQTVEVSLIDTSALTGKDLEASETINANRINKALIKTLNKLSWDTNKFNDQGFTEIIDNNDLKLIIKNSNNTDILVDSIATLLNSNKITDAQKWGKTFVVPDEKFSNSDDVIAWLLHNRKIQYGYYYVVATSFFDASTLNQNNWLHFAYYLDTIKSYPAIKFVKSVSA